MQSAASFAAAIVPRPRLASPICDPVDAASCVGGRAIQSGQQVEKPRGWREVSTRTGPGSRLAISRWSSPERIARRRAACSTRQAAQCSRCMQRDPLGLVAELAQCRAPASCGSRLRAEAAGSEDGREALELAA